MKETYGGAANENERNERIESSAPTQHATIPVQFCDHIPPFDLPEGAAESHALPDPRHDPSRVVSKNYRLGNSENCRPDPRMI